MSLTSYRAAPPRVRPGSPWLGADGSRCASDVGVVGAAVAVPSGLAWGGVPGRLVDLAATYSPTS